MNPQEQNKAKVQYQNPTSGTPDNQRNEAGKKPVATNGQPGMQDKNRKDMGSGKPEDKEEDDCSTTKGSCSTK